MRIVLRDKVLPTKNRIFKFLLGLNTEPKRYHLELQHHHLFEANSKNEAIAAIYQRYKLQPGSNVLVQEGIKNLAAKILSVTDLQHILVELQPITRYHTEKQQQLVTVSELVFGGKETETFAVSSLNHLRSDVEFLWPMPSTTICFARNKELIPESQYDEWTVGVLVKQQKDAWTCIIEQGKEQVIVPLVYDANNPIIKE